MNCKHCGAPLGSVGNYCLNRECQNAKQRAHYQRGKRRPDKELAAEFLADKHCEICGSTEDLGMVSNVPGKPVYKLAPWRGTCARSDFSILCKPHKLQVLGQRSAKRLADRNRARGQANMTRADYQRQWKARKEAEEQAAREAWVLQPPSAGELAAAEKRGREHARRFYDVEIIPAGVAWTRMDGSRAGA